MVITLNSHYPLNFIGIGLPAENPLRQTWAAPFARVRLRNLCLSTKKQAFSPLDGFAPQTDTGSDEIYGLKKSLDFKLDEHKRLLSGKVHAAFQ